MIYKMRGRIASRCYGVWDQQENRQLRIWYGYLWASFGPYELVLARVESKSWEGCMNQMAADFRNGRRRMKEINQAFCRLAEKDA